jgi:hypothetical protein
MLTENDKAYIAGLFDGEGSVDYTQRWEKRTKGRRYKVWRIIMDIAMTDELVIRWVHEILGVGSVMEKPPRKPHYKKQWRWRCSFREALYVAKLLWPHAQTKLHKLEQIIDHYDTEDEAKPSADIIYLKDKRK